MAGLVQVVIVLLLACSLCAHARIEDAEFLKWVSEYGIQVEDLDKIYPVWRKNADFVREQNSLDLSYSLSLNQFAHLTTSELIGDAVIVEPKPPAAIHRVSSSPLPPSIDWREKGAVLPVKNQGQLGCAGAFAIVESVASFGAIKTGKLVSPSIEEYVDCCLNGSCSGGAPFGAGGFDCIAKLGGLACDYPSTVNHTCRSKDVKPCVVISGGKEVVSGSEEALAEALLVQPIAVAVDASHMSFQFYKSGVYYESSCSKSRLDHAMLLVGYGTTDKNEDYWLLENSWGKSWDMEGYVMMSRNRGNNCGIATNAIYPY